MIDDALREYAETPDRFAPIPEGSSVTRYDDGRICIVQGTIWASISGAALRRARGRRRASRYVHERVPRREAADLVDRPVGAARRTSSSCCRAAGSCPRRTAPEVRAMVLTSPPPAAPGGIEVRRIETFDDFVASREVQWDAFDVPQDRRELQRRTFAPTSTSRWQHGVPVGFLAHARRQAGRDRRSRSRRRAASS